MANAVVDAINQAVSDDRTRLAMLMGSYLESGWNPAAVGDNGTSFGPFQMHIGGALTSSGLSPEQAKNPELATRAMLGQYQGAVNKVSDSLWNSNPRQAAALAAYYAERPAQMYPTARINEAWRAMTSGGGGGILGTARGIAGNIGGLFTGSTERKIGGAIGGAAQSTGEKVLGAVWNTVGAKVLFVSAGLGLIALGAYQTFKPRIEEKKQEVLQLAGIAAKAGA